MGQQRIIRDKKIPLRAEFWDYAAPGFYFITINLTYRKHHFGKVTDGCMELSKIGEIARDEWVKSFLLRPEMHLFMGPFVVMPDHFHAIIGLGDSIYNAELKTSNAKGGQSNNLSSIIRGFKGAVTRRAREITPSFEWQSLYHDRIIRDCQEMKRICHYIVNNPQNWKNR